MSHCWFTPWLREYCWTVWLSDVFTSRTKLLATLSISYRPGALNAPCGVCAAAGRAPPKVSKTIHRTMETAPATSIHACRFISAPPSPPIKCTCQALLDTTSYFRSLTLMCLYIYCHFGTPELRSALPELLSALDDC